MARRYKNPPIELEPLEKLYIFRSPDEVLDFLQKYPFLVPVLLEAPEKIQPYFPSARLFLELFQVPEAPDNSHLIISVSTDLAVEEAIETLHQLDGAWLLNLPNRILRKIATDVVITR